MGCFPKLFRRRSITPDGGDVIRHRSQVKDKDADADAVCCSKKYSWNDIEILTMSFSRVIGSGGFSSVFLAHLPNLTLGAVKIHEPSDHLNRFFKQELDILLQLRHDNIVKLLGYCDDQERGALVLEYVPNGNLQDKLHGAQTDQILSWKKRMAIAFQLAQALEYLHEKCNLQIVHGDIKASNILLDDNLDCKLCDFGFAKMGFSSLVMPSKQVMMGSPGYTDPYYLRTGIASKKNDVYSYGVIVLELVTGMEPFCEVRGQLLTSIMGSMLGDVRDCEATKIAEMVDPRLAGDFELKEVRAMLSLSAFCLRHSPVLRPSAAQILHQIRDNVPSISTNMELLNL